MPSMPKPPRPTPSKAETVTAGHAGGAVRSSQGLAVAGNLVACVVVGMLLGWGVDWAIGTKPWGMLVGLGLGFMAWLRELWRLLKSPPTA
ncbi:MAG: AtpZ/AtpI family protein [Alphaproteobacteria bacterium]|nr:AtpZ/AtpI family protein [Alphaproteobacteria bacterium]